MNASVQSPAVFNFQNFPINVILKDGEPWFIATEVCAAIEIKNHRDAISRLDDDEKGVVKTDTLGGEQQVTIISEPGLYRLISRSNKPAAKSFNRWACHDVFPAIRKTGSYTQSPYSSNPTDTLTLAQCDQLRDMMRTAADGMLSQDAGKFMVSGWSKLKAHFGVAYRQIPQYKFSDALAIISRHVADHAAKQLPPPAAPLFGQRILTRLEEGGRYTSQIISPTAHIIEMSDLDEILKRAGKMIVPIEAVRALQGLAI